MFVAFSFSTGYKRFSSALERKPYPHFYGCPHCFRRKTKQYSVRLNVYFILQFICPLFSGTSGNLIYVNDYFTIVYLQAIFLKHTFLLDWYGFDREQWWKDIQRCSNRTHFRFTARLLQQHPSSIQQPLWCKWGRRSSEVVGSRRQVSGRVVGGARQSEVVGAEK